MEGSSRSSVVVTWGTYTQDQNVTPGIDAPKNKANVYISGQLLFFYGWGIWIEEQCKDTNMQRGTKQTEEMKKGKPGDSPGHLANG
ncbi:hypothetical protein H5410_051079 [Solanum commersonii]|uniref:Uncharacterized protein n=1 Tax=Solanum commersonii TaxID=4109 RepID=A0A9J5WZG2_SOLCO|nr:hypothetical protein H5410_051079 [Solanum commersonii]